MLRSKFLRAVLLALAVSQVSTPALAQSNQLFWGWNRNNKPPTITGTPSTTVVAGSAYSFAPTAKDPEGSRIRFAIRNRPSWAQFDYNTGVLRGTPQSSNVGTYTGIVIYASDGRAPV